MKMPLVGRLWLVGKETMASDVGSPAKGSGRRRTVRQ